jgi:predicted AlkP superfamily pyrophosphatase or phosphodiesterase
MLAFLSKHLNRYMKKLIATCFLGFLLIHISNAQNQSKKTVFIILDGISYDVIQQVETPHIDRISSMGGFSKAYVGGERGGYSETPTISAVGYNSLLTGTWVNKHNVFGNSIRRPNYHYWSIFRYLREANPDAHLAIFSTWEDNRTKLLGEGMDETGNLKLDYAFDGFELDTLNFPHDPKKKYIFDIDELVSKEAASYIENIGPDLSWVYLEYPDDMGHQFGDSPELYNAVKEADRQTGDIFNAVLKRIEMGEDWLIIVTTDHGRQPTTGLHHGGQSDREREIWVSTNAQGLNSYFDQDTVAIVDILPTMLRFMDLDIPESNLNEIDGVPFIGQISIYHPSIKKSDQEYVFSWQFDGAPEEDIEIWVTYNNSFRTSGKADEYQHIITVKGNLQSVTFPIAHFEQDQMKVLFKGKHNTVNKWIVKDKKNE